MRYFSGLRFHAFNELPACAVWLDRVFPHHALNLVAAGSIRFREAGGAWSELVGPSAFWTVPGVRYQYGVTGPASWHHFYATFSGRRLEAWLRGGLFPGRRGGRPFVALADGAGFRASFQGLLGVLSRCPEGDAEAVHRLEGLLLALTLAVHTEGIGRGVARRVSELGSEIEQEPAAPRDFARVAREFGWTLPHFRRVFRRVTGLSPVAFHIRARMDRAAALLRSTDEPIKAIADRVGIPDVFYFTKLFRRAYGRPPGEYRRVLQLQADPVKGRSLRRP